MPLGSQTLVVDGQRNLFPSSYAFAPTQYGPQTTGVPNVSPTNPPFIGANNGGGSTQYGSGMAGVGGYGTSDNNLMVTQTANQNPHNWKVSPVWWAVAFGIIGIVALNGIHWRKTTLEGVQEHAHVGAVSEAGSEEA